MTEAWNSLRIETERRLLRSARKPVVLGDAIVFGRRLTRRLQAGQSVHGDQALAGTGKNRTESLDGAAIDLTVFHEPGKVVSETKVNDGVRGGCASAEDLDVLKRARLNLRPQGGERAGAVF